MTIRVLGCSGAIAAGCRTTSFLLDEVILIDAGTGVGDLTLNELSCIDHICISHSHLDHVLSIGLLADSVMRERAARGAPPVQVHALPETLAALTRHILNGEIWPDFTRLPTPAAPVLSLNAFQVGDVLNLAGRHIEVLKAVHSVPAVGFAVRGSEGYWIFTGDTGLNPILWKRLSQMQITHLVIETAFSDDEYELAQLSQHLCPRMLGEELSSLSGSVDVHITHIKPGESDAVMAQIKKLNTPHRINMLSTGQLMQI